MKMFVALTLAISVFTAQTAFSAKLTRSFVIQSINYYGDSDGDGDREFGGCLLNVTPSPHTVLSGCGNIFVAPSCDGTFGAKSLAASIMDQANLAVVTNRSIVLSIDNTKLHSGYCYVEYAGTVW